MARLDKPISQSGPTPAPNRFSEDSRQSVASREDVAELGATLEESFDRLERPFGEMEARLLQGLAEYEQAVTTMIWRMVVVMLAAYALVVGLVLSFF